jgi:phosphoglycolate phosphatase-like HAD superfamily hydrolase
MELGKLLTGTQAKVVFMDCDGVIYDTNRLKCDAFRYALDGYPTEAVEAIVAYHRRTGGVSRYLKIERFFAELHPVADPRAAAQTALQRFADFCERGYERMRPRPEALAFAERFGGPERVQVVSGSDEAELRRVFEAADLAHRFAGVHGSPVGKKTHLTRLLAAHKATAAEALFVGDGWGDWDAATALGIPFVYLAEMSEWDDGPSTIAAAGSALVTQADTWEDLLAAVRAS